MLCLVCRKGPPVPQLSLSEDFVLSAASVVRIELNNALRVARDVALGNDFKLFLQVYFLPQVAAVLIMCPQEYLCYETMFLNAF